MAKKKFRFAVAVGAADPSRDHPGVVDNTGASIVPAMKGVKIVPPGEVVEMEEAAGIAIIARHGGFVEPVKVDTSVTKVGEASAVATLKA